MENEKVMQISALAAVIHSKLEEIRYITSVKQLVSIFQELVVKLLQFSSKIHQAKKILKDELERRNIKVLLKSIKDSIPELSGACQDSLNANSFQLFKRKEDVIRKLRYTVEVAENIIKDQMSPDYRSLQQFSRKTTDEDEVGLFHGVIGGGLDDDSNSYVSTPLPLSVSKDLSEFVEVSQFHSVPSNNNHLRLGFQTLSLNSMEIKKQINELFKNQEHFVSCDKYTKQDFGKKLLHNIDEFISMAKTFEGSKDSCDIAKVCNELHELGLDFVSMILDYNSSNMREDDFTILLNVQKHLEKYLHDIIQIVQNAIGKEGLLTSNELGAKEIIEKIPIFAARRNFIGLVDSTVVFFDTCKSYKTILKEMAHASFQEEFQTFEIKFQTESREIEYVLNEVIERIDDEEAIQRLVANMHNFVDLLNECHGLFLSKPTDKAGCSAILRREAPSRSSIAKNDSAVKTNVSVLVEQFIKAINDVDYKTVEILANRLLSNIKLVGELLQGITSHSPKDVRDLRHLFSKYFKIAGGFCSQARKLVLSDMDRDVSVDSLVNTGIEMADMRKKFFQKCKISLRPWFDLSCSILRVSFKEQSKQKRKFLGVTKKLRQLVETLSETEYVEQQNIKSKLTKLSNLITKTSELTTHGRDGYSNSGFLLDFYGLQWACAALNFLEIVDRVSVSCLHYDPSSFNNEELLELSRTWISMLQTLSMCCTDVEASKEVSKISDQLISIATSIENEEHDEDVDGIIEFSIIRRELFANILVAIELTDILTQGAKEPMRGYIDPLESLSFAPNLQSFLAIRDAFHGKMDVVHTMSCLAVRDSVFRAKAHQVFVAADELKDISNELISTLQSSHDESKKKLYFLKLRWRLAATYLIKTLLMVPEANYTAVAGVMRHLESASHDARYNDLISVLNDFGSRKAFSKDAWKLKREMSPNGFFADEISADFNGSICSILDYPNSGDTNVLPASLPRIESSESTYFRNYSMNLQEESSPPLPLIQTPDTFNPQSSFSSTRSSSSHDTEIFIPKVAKKPSVGATKDARKGAHQERIRSTESTYSPEGIGRASWEMSSKDEVDGPMIVKNESKISQSIAAAAQILLRELEEWEEDENSIITVVKKMTNQMLDMADYAMGTGDLKNKEDFINTAKAIAANAHIVAKFAVIIADHCLDETCQLNLLHYAEIVPTLSTQLNIIASVKAATPNDETADVMLIANAENLMRSVSGTLRAAESASVKMKCDSEGKDGAARGKTAALAIRWKKKLDFRRSMESITAPTNELGLKIIRDDSSWSLTDLS